MYKLFAPYILHCALPYLFHNSQISRKQTKREKSIWAACERPQFWKKSSKQCSVCRHDLSRLALVLAFVYTRIVLFLRTRIAATAASRKTKTAVDRRGGEWAKKRKRENNKCAGQLKRAPRPLNKVPFFSRRAVSLTFPLQTCNRPSEWGNISWLMELTVCCRGMI